MSVYLLHFHKPISDKHTTQHYLGYADDVMRRLAQHRAGTAARLTQVAKERGIGFCLVRIWDGDRSLERALKNQHNAPRLCPLCSSPIREDVNFWKP